MIKLLFVGILFLSGCGTSKVPNDCAVILNIGTCDIFGLCSVRLSTGEVTKKELPIIGERFCKQVE